MKLNAAQQRAIAHLSGPMMVLAGPGSGKTSVIAERTAYLVRSGATSPANILVVTFSRAAAKEMRERFLQKTASGRTDVTFGTFHGVFFGILCDAFRLTSANILTDKEKTEILRGLAMEHCPGLCSEGDFLEDLAREISVVKENRIDTAHYYSASCPDEVFSRIYREYLREQQNRRKLDFDDMLLRTWELFHKRPDILERWQKRFTHILVDEFQDVNRLQYEIVRMLASPEDNLFVVGDDDQSIYHFRGASPGIMLGFSRDYQNADRVLLDINYRCTKEILSAASRLIANNRERFSKKLSTPNPKGRPVASLVYEDPREQFLSVVKVLRNRLDAGEDISDSAVLFRTNQEAEELVRLFLEYQIPFMMKEKLPNLFDHWICRDLMAYLHLSQGDFSRQDLLTIMNRPNRYIRREAVSSAVKDLSPLFAYYRTQDWMIERLNTFRVQLKVISRLNPFAAVNYIRNAVGYEEYLQEYAEYRKIKPDELTEILDRLQESTRGKKDLMAWEESIRTYTEQLAARNNAAPRKEPGVCVSTLHGAKGLEYPFVWILNCNEGSIPYRKAVLPEAVEEERRLLYVGMTRAREQLTLCHVKSSYEHQREPSRFLKEAGL